MESEILAKVIRGETVESFHRGHLIIVDGEGARFLRSEIPKPNFLAFSVEIFQAMPLITSGGAAHFDFSDEGNRARLRFAFGRRNSH